MDSYSHYNKMYVLRCLYKNYLKNIRENNFDEAKHYIKCFLIMNHFYRPILNAIKINFKFFDYRVFNLIYISDITRLGFENVSKIDFFNSEYFIGKEKIFRDIFYSYIDFRKRSKFLNLLDKKSEAVGVFLSCINNNKYVSPFEKYNSNIRKKLDNAHDNDLFIYESLYENKLLKYFLALKESFVCRDCSHLSGLYSRIIADYENVDSKLVFSAFKKCFDGEYALALCDMKHLYLNSTGGIYFLCMCYALIHTLGSQNKTKLEDNLFVLYGWMPFVMNLKNSMKSKKFNMYWDLDFDLQRRKSLRKNGQSIINNYEDDNKLYDRSEVANSEAGDSLEDINNMSENMPVQIEMDDNYLLKSNDPVVRFILDRSSSPL